MLLNNFFEVRSAVFEYEILRSLSVLVLAVVNVEHPDDVLALSELVKNFELTTHVFARLCGSLHCYSHLVHFVISLKHISYTSQNKEDDGRDKLPKDPEPIIFLGSNSRYSPLLLDIE